MTIESLRSELSIVNRCNYDIYQTIVKIICIIIQMLQKYLYWEKAVDFSNEKEYTS